METPQNKFIENVYELANEIDANFIIANAELDFYPVIYCSQRFFEDIGWTRNEVTTKDVYCNFLKGRITDKKTFRTFEKGIKKKVFTQVEIIIYSKAGTKRWFLITLVPVKNARQDVSVFLVFFNFISHLKPYIPDSPLKLWKIATRRALNKPCLEYFRKHIDAKKDAERKKKYDVNTIKSKIQNMFIPTYGLTKPQIPRYLIRHSHLLKSLWDSFILLCILYTSAMVPFLVAFKYTTMEIVIFDTIVDVMFIFDIGLTFVTTYVENGEIITNSRLIRRNYFRGWFTLDSIAALPYSVVNFILGDTNSLEILSSLKILRLIRLGKVSKKIGRYMQMSAVTLGVWLLVFCLCAHWMACVWYVIATSWDKPGIQHHSWLYMLSEITNEPYNFTSDGSIVEGTGPDYFTVYISALYYTMSSLTTCGFGNIAPNTAAEKVFGFFTMLLGCVLYALIFGQVTNIISQLQKGSNEFTEQMSSIRNFNTIYKMPPKVAKRLEDFFIATWAVTKGTDEEQILKPCPRDLQSDLCLNIHKTVFESNPAFKHLSDSALRALSRYFWTIRTAPGDKLINTGEDVNTVYFIANGSLEIYSNNDLTGLIGPKDSFGKRLTDDHATNSVYDVKSCSFAAIHCITIESIKEALLLYPEEFDKIKYDLVLAFDITRQLVTVTKSGEVISTEVSFKEKEKELQRTLSKHQSSNSLVQYDHEHMTALEQSYPSSSHFDVLSGMSELKGELRRETERMNAKMGVVEAQMRLVLKLLRRNNKIEVDPEIGMQLGELMQYDDKKDEEVAEDFEWFVADSQGWRDGAPPTTGGTSGSRSSLSRGSNTTVPHHKVIMSTPSKNNPPPPSSSKQPVRKTPSQTEASKTAHTIIDVNKDGASLTKRSSSKSINKAPVKNNKQSPTSNKSNGGGAGGKKNNEGFEEEDGDFETIHL